MGRPQGLNGCCGLERVTAKPGVYIISNVYFFYPVKCNVTNESYIF